MVSIHIAKEHSVWRELARLGICLCTETAVMVVTQNYTYGVGRITRIASSIGSALVGAMLGEKTADYTLNLYDDLSDCCKASRAAKEAERR